MDTTFASLLTLAGLGAFHGLNPGMGWLFAVALGMQEGKRNAVWRALIPLTLGHALAIAAAIGVAMIAGTAISRHAALARGDPARGPRHLQLYRHLHPAGQPCGWAWAPDALVFSHGVGARRD